MSELKPTDDAHAEKFRKILVLDFDGVLHSYKTPWQGAAVIPDRPVRGAIKALFEYSRKFDIAILSSRSHQPGGIDAMRDWLSQEISIFLFEETGSEYSEDGAREAADEWVEENLTFPTEKPPAHVTIDDRAITFTGTWPTSDELAAFKPWYKR